MIRYTSLTRGKMTAEDAHSIEARALSMGVDAGVIWNARKRWYEAGAHKGKGKEGTYVSSEGMGLTVAEALTKSQPCQSTHGSSMSPKCSRATSARGAALSEPSSEYDQPILSMSSISPWSTPGSGRPSSPPGRPRSNA